VILIAHTIEAQQKDGNLFYTLCRPFRLRAPLWLLDYASIPFRQTQKRKFRPWGTARIITHRACTFSQFSHAAKQRLLSLYLHTHTHTHTHKRARRTPCEKIYTVEISQSRFCFNVRTRNLMQSRLGQARHAHTLSSTL